MICRIFHKIAEKKSLLQQGQNYLFRASSFYNPSFTTNSLPPLLEPHPTLMESHHHQDQTPLFQTLNQNPFLTHSQESDFKTLINPLVPQPALLASNQDMGFKDLSSAIARQCKKESEFQTHLQLLSEGSGHMRWGGEKIEESSSKYLQNPFIFGVNGCGNMGIPSATVGDHSVTAAMDAATAPIDHVMSTEPAFRWWS